MNRRIIQLCSAVLLAVLSVFMIKTAMGTEQPVPARAAAMEAPETEQQTTVPDGADIRTAGNRTGRGRNGCSSRDAAHVIGRNYGKCRDAGVCHAFRRNAQTGAGRYFFP